MPTTPCPTSESSSCPLTEREKDAVRATLFAESFEDESKNWMYHLNVIQQMTDSELLEQWMVRVLGPTKTAFMDSVSSMANLGLYRLAQGIAADAR
jgi:hypothetical protein